MSDELIGRGIIEVVADGTSVSAGMEQATAAVDRFEKAAVDAGKNAGAALGAAGKQGGLTGEKLDATTRRFIASLERESQQVGRTRAEYLELRASQLGVSDSTAAMIARIRESEKVVTSVGISAKQTAAAMRGVPAQLTDIVTSLQAGQAPLQVFLQQGGQLKDMFGGVVPAARALGTTVLGLVNPFTVAAVAAGVLAYAYKQGSEEADEFARATILTGNAAGATVDQLATMATRIDAVVGTTGAAAEALAALAATGYVGAGSLEEFAIVAVRFERLTGQAVKETAKQFAELGKAPAEASRKLNEQYRYLTASVYEQIRALEEQGKTVEAARVAQEAYATAAETRLGQLQDRLGTIERLWIGVKDAAKEGWDAILDIGRPETGADRLASLQAQLAQRESQGARRGTLRTAGQNDEITERLRDQIALLQAAERENAKLADRDRERVQINESAIKAQTEIERIRKESTTNQEKLNKALSDYRRNIDSIRRADPASAFLDPKKVAKDEADIRAKFADKSGASAAGQLRKSTLDFDLAGIRAGLDAVTGAYRNSEAQLDAIRGAGLISEREYYDAKLGFLAANTAAQEQSLGDEIARLQREKVAGKDRVDNDRKIVEAQAKLATLRANATSQAELLSIRERASLQSVARGYEEARIAAQEYLNTLTLQQNRELGGLGRGSRSREIEGGRNQINDRYQAQRNQLEANKQLLELEGKFTEEARAQYQTRLGIIDEFNQKALQGYEGYVARRRDLETSWEIGASEALENYLETARNVSAQSQEFFQNSFKGMEDALVEFVRTGKLDFGSLANSIIADLARIAIRAQLAGIFGALMTPSVGAGSNVNGYNGTLNNPSAYVPNLDTGSDYIPYDGFMARLHKGERVVPAKFNPVASGPGAAGAGAGGGGMEVELNVINNGAPVQAEKSVRQSGTKMIVDLVLSEAASNVKRGGVLGEAISSTYGMGRQTKRRG